MFSKFQPDFGLPMVPDEEMIKVCEKVMKLHKKGMTIDEISKQVKLDCDIVFEIIRDTKISESI